MANALGILDKLRTIELFEDLTDTELATLAKGMFPKHYLGGQTLFFSGMPGELMYVVLSGELEILRSDTDGEHLVALLGPGQFAGEGSLILEGHRSTNCRVHQDSELLILTKRTYQDLVASNPAITTKLLTAFLKTNIVRLRRGNQPLQLA